MSRIFWDTNVFIYLFEKHPVHHAEVVRLRTKMLKRGDELLTSWLTVGEMQVQTKVASRQVSSVAYKDAIAASSTLLSFGEDAANSYRDLREATSVKGPDAMQLACAAAAGVELFVTNDKKLQSVRVAGIHFVASIAGSGSAAIVATPSRRSA
jgi:predicted nucleic acid-binding protein